MRLVLLESLPKPSLKALLDHFSIIDDPRQPWKVAHPLPEVLLLVVCATICDCDGYDQIAAWGRTHLAVLRRYLPYHQEVPCGRWLTLLMNRISPACFPPPSPTGVRATWPDRIDLVALDGKTSRRSHDRAERRPPLHLVSAFATTCRLVLGQEAVPDKAGETAAIPVLIERLAVDDGLKGALISIDAIATNAAIAGSILAAGADYLLAVKANQPTLRAEIEALFSDAPSGTVDVDRSLDKGHGRIEERSVAVAREVDWLTGTRRLPGETRLPGIACLIRVRSRAELKGSLSLRDALLRLLRRSFRRPRRRGRPRPLADRERPALGARRHLRRRPEPPAQRPRRPQHGCRAPLRLQPAAPRARTAAARAITPQTRPQTQQQTQTDKPQTAPKMASWSRGYTDNVLSAGHR